MYCPYCGEKAIVHVGKDLFMVECLDNCVISEEMTALLKSRYFLLINRMEDTQVAESRRADKLKEAEREFIESMREIASRYNEKSHNLAKEIVKMAEKEKTRM